MAERQFIASEAALSTLVCGGPDPLHDGAALLRNAQASVLREPSLVLLYYITKKLECRRARQDGQTNDRLMDGWRHRGTICSFQGAHRGSRNDERHGHSRECGKRLASDCHKSQRRQHWGQVGK